MNFSTLEQQLQVGSSTYPPGLYMVDANGNFQPYNFNMMMPYTWHMEDKYYYFWTIIFLLFVLLVVRLMK